MISRPKKIAVMRYQNVFNAAIWLGLFSAGWSLAAYAERPLDTTPSVEESIAVHGQLTYTEQESGPFKTPYSGANSLSADRGRETVDATLFVGARLWSGAEAWVAPEVDQGFGLDGTLGAAGFPSAEAYKVGRKTPYLRLSRAFIRQTFDVDATKEMTDGSQMQLVGHQSNERWVITVGKFSVTDIFDNNQYAHDPKSNFLNWAAVDTGTFDYAADAWGYTVGIAAERYHGAWVARVGWMDLSNVPNSPHLEPGGHEFELLAEVEHQHTLWKQPGKWLITAYDNRGRMALLNQAVATAEQRQQPIDLSAVRHYRSRTGLSASVEQSVSEDLGLFARLGKASGNVEAYDFTEIDQTIGLGMALKGTPWSRPMDTVGLVGIVNGISAARQQFLQAGGLGLLVGDGQLPHPASERILESYYSAQIGTKTAITLDAQLIKNPGYNSDRGPAPIYAIRLHSEF